MADEPAYLKMLRKNRKEVARSGVSGAAPSADRSRYSVQEKEALKWAREAAGGADPKSVRDLAGARYALLVKLSSVTGTSSLSLEGLATREALLDRLKKGAGMGEEIIGSYEVKGGRPITVSTSEGGEPTLTLGAPRPGANPLPPEKMLRKAMADAEKRAKERPRGGDGDRGGRGGGGGRRG